MNNKIKFTALITLSVLLLFAFRNLQESKYIGINKDGSLNYKADEDGNIIPDFSRVGYHQGDIEIPTVTVVKTLSPALSGSSQEMIQAAIDEVSSYPIDKNGFRGAILLKKGIYAIPQSIHINKSGIVLRGEGEATQLVATGKGQRSLILIAGTGTAKEIIGTRTKLAEDHVPVGRFYIAVKNPEYFKVGDAIVVCRPGTEQWIKDLKMDQIDLRDGTKQWEAKGYNLNFERVITKIIGNQIYIDQPMVMPLDQKYGGAEIYKYVFNGRIAEVGIEHMSMQSEYISETDEDHGWEAIQINKLAHGWVRNVKAQFFGFSCVSIGSDAKYITVRDSKCFDHKSIITGGRRYSFNVDGQFNLVANCEAREGRHDYVTGARTLGPNVFYNCKATGTHADIGPHHRWSVGTLYDNISTDGEINIQDRGNWGTGHGWVGTTQVVWNASVKRAAVQNPWISGKNYAIGIKGEKYNGRLAGRLDGSWESRGEFVVPQSLYLAQSESKKHKLFSQR
jgi:hypothetical protein